MSVLPISTQCSGLRPAGAKDPARRKIRHHTDLFPFLSPRSSTDPPHFLNICPDPPTSLPAGEPGNVLPLGSCGPFGLTGGCFVFCSCFWARSFSANRWALMVPDAAAAEQNGFEKRLKTLPKRCLEPQTQRRGALELGAAILSKEEGRL